MSAQAIYLKSALAPSARQIVPVAPGRTIRELAPAWDVPYIAMLDGEPVLRADWELALEDGRSVAFVDVRGIPQGGGGGGGSDPLRTVAMIALLVMAPEIAGALEFSAMGVAGMEGLVLAGGQYLSAGVMIAGSALINAVIPPPKPPTPQQAAALTAPSPTYNIQAQGNSARIDAAIPEQFGRMQSWPDFGAQPYQEFEDNEQYLNVLLCLGRGEYDIEAIRIQDTPIGSFEEITTEVIPPYGGLTLLQSNVTSSTEVSGQELNCISGSYSQTGTTITVTAVAHGLAAGRLVFLDFTSGAAADNTYTVTSAPTADTFTVTAASATTSGNVLVSEWIGGFIANSATSTAWSLGFDLVCPKGLFYANTDGSLASVSLTVELQSRPVDDAGSPTAGWTSLGTVTYSGAVATPQRKSERYGVALGRFEVRARRTTAKNTDTKYYYDVNWGGLKAYLSGPQTFGDMTMIALKMRASNNLGALASRRISVISTRKLPVWSGGAWSANTATRNPAWALAYACKQAGLRDDQIDLSALATLAATWAGRSDYFDARFDNFLAFWEAIAKVAQAGRAKPFMQGGAMRFVRDQAATIPVALFSQRNIAKGSFSVDYLMPTPDTADAIDVGYFDSRNWMPMRTQAKLPGSIAAKPAKVDMFGITNAAQANREGLYQAAANRYRRKLIRFATEMEGFIPSFGDLIAVQHDMPSWGQGGEVVGIVWPGPNPVFDLSEKLAWGTGTHYIAFRAKDGGLHGPYVATPSGSLGNQVVANAMPAWELPYVGQDQERTHYVFGPAETWRQPAKVISVKPQSATSVTIEAVNEDPSVHTADSTGVSAPVVYSQGSLVYAPVLTDLVVTPGSGSSMTLTWAASPGADHYVIEQSGDGATWTRSGTTSQTSYVTNALYGNGTLVRVAAVGVNAGPWVQGNYYFAAGEMWHPDSTTPMWSGNDNNLMWS